MRNSINLNLWGIGSIRIDRLVRIRKDWVDTEEIMWEVSLKLSSRSIKKLCNCMKAKTGNI